MKLQGYTKLGGGVDGVAFTKHEGTVIKILVPRGDEETKLNMGRTLKPFTLFYQFCMKNQKLPCLPKFHEISGSHTQPFVVNGTEYLQIAMERLLPLPQGSMNYGMTWFLSSLIDMHMKWEDIKGFLDNPEKLEDFMESYPGKDKKKLIQMMKKMTPHETLKYEILAKTMVLLYDIGKTNGLGWDLHTSNVMQRSDGMPVIIDPWVLF
jgi:hypothetical protein